MGVLRGVQGNGRRVGWMFYFRKNKKIEKKKMMKWTKKKKDHSESHVYNAP
jgi:hypothetical protein